MKKIFIKAPGRVCLFGEHQDYLGLPVISAAISLFIYIEAKAALRRIAEIHVEYRDLNQKETILLNGKELQYEKKRDYIKSVYNLFLRAGYSFDRSYDCSIHGNIPINAGAASSSALTVAWVAFLSKITNANLSKQQIAEMAHSAEVLEFSESGGMMDQLTSSCGNLLYIETKPLAISRLKAKIDGLVLGDSLEKKSTLDDLARVKIQSLKGQDYLKKCIKGFDLKTTDLNTVKKHLDDSQEAKNILANIINRDLTKKARSLLSEEIFDKKALGKLLNEHHDQLNENLGISTAKINKIIDASLAAGALGAKINGSGFGGTMFAYAPNHEKEVASAIKDCGGEPHVVKIVPGVNEK
jgi:galactokinase